MERFGVGRLPAALHFVKCIAKWPPSLAGPLLRSSSSPPSSVSALAAEHWRHVGAYGDITMIVKTPPSTSARAADRQVETPLRRPAETQRLPGRPPGLVGRGGLGRRRPVRTTARVFAAGEAGVAVVGVSAASAAPPLPSSPSRPRAISERWRCAPWPSRRTRGGRCRRRRRTAPWYRPD